MNESHEFWFDHETLEVYQEAIAWLTPLLESMARLGDVKKQLDLGASVSVFLNIAEGNGKFSLKDRCRFLDTAHGSALECASGLDILVAESRLTHDEIRPRQRVPLQKVVRMLMGLIKKNSTRDYGKGTPTD